MTHQEMLDQVVDELRNTNIDTKITRWLNLGITEITNRFVFGHLNKYFSTPTALGVPDMPMATDFLWLKTIQIPGSSKKLYPDDELRLSEGYPLYRTQQGTIESYYINGLNIGFWQVPSGVFTVTGSYQKRGATLLADKSVTCDLPLEWHEFVCQKAITRGNKRDSDLAAVQLSEGREREIAKRIGVTAYKRPDEVVIAGGISHSARPPRPILPSGYPRV